MTVNRLSHSRPLDLEGRLGVRLLSKFKSSASIGSTAYLSTCTYVTLCNTESALEPAKLSDDTLGKICTSVFHL